MTLNNVRCLACGEEHALSFLELPGVPVFCNVLWETAAQALAAPRGNLELSICPDCGHVFNAGFDPDLVRYAEGYENSLHHSPRFQSYAEELARDLRRRHQLTGAHVVEIACGQGDFLKLICADEGTTGSGYDPSYRGDEVAPGVAVHREYFGERPLAQAVDLVCCRHALEHIDDPVAFLRQVQSVLPDDSDAVFFFEVPNSLYSLRDGGVWDFIYEHVSYFCGTSLAACFERAGLRVGRTWETFAGQFLCLEAGAKAVGTTPGAVAPVPSAAELVGLAQGLSREVEALLAKWRSAFAAVRKTGGKVAVWGAGSKGVTFLNLMGTDADLCVPVDINPDKCGRYVAGTGHKVLSPGELPAAGVELVLVMNPVYTTEITQMVGDLGLTVEVSGV